MALTEVGTKGIKDASIKLEDFENGTTSDAGKFLKNVDGGAPVWDTVDTTTIPVTNEGTDTTCYPVFTTDDTGDQSPKTNTSLKYNSNSGRFDAAGFYATGQGTSFTWLGPGSSGTGTSAGYLEADGILLSGTTSGPCSMRFCGNTETDYVGFSSVGSSLPSGTQLIWKLPTADATSSGQALTSDAAGNLAWGDVASAKGGGTDKMFWENSNEITEDYSIGDNGTTNNINAMTIGPVTIAATKTVTIGSTHTWTVI